MRNLVPGWVEWLGPVLFLVGSAAIVAFLPIAAVRLAVRRIKPDQHWTERVRYVHAARVSIVWATATVPAGIWLLATVTIGPVGRLPGWLLGAGGVVVAGLAVARLSWWLEASVLRQPVPEWRRYLGAFLVRLAPLAAIIVLALAAPARLSSPWMLLWMAVAIGVVVTLRYQLELLTWFGFARPADRRLTTIVGRAAARAGVEAPAVYTIDHHRPNAFAFPWRGRVAFTTRAVAELSNGELDAVALHELGHLAESTGSSILRQALHFVWIPVVAIKPIIGSLETLGMFVVVAVLGGLLIAVRRFAGTMESRSDSHALANVEESRVFGGALEKIYRIGLIPAVLRRPAHGQLRDRLARTGWEADFDPPAPPPTRALGGFTAAAVLVGAAIFLAPYLATIGAGLSSPTPAHVALALGSYGSWPFERLGQLADSEGDLEAAEVFYGAAVEASSDPDPLVDLVYVRSVLGRCEDAEGALVNLTEQGGMSGDLSVAAEWVDWCYQQWDGGG